MNALSSDVQRRMDELMDRVVRIPFSGCWIWTGSLRWDGYGKPRFQGREEYAHRLFFAYFNGPLAAGDCVLHRCDVRCCVNPAHLFVGSRRDNMLDMWAKGRGRVVPQRGIRHGCARLTEEQVRAIRADGGIARLVAPKYGISVRTVGAIRRGEKWAHLPL